MNSCLDLIGVSSVICCVCILLQVYIEKQKGEMLGVVIVESGWGSILPTVIIASMMHFGPAEKSGRLNIGDQLMTINGTSLVGLPLSTCQSIIKVCLCLVCVLSASFPHLPAFTFSLFVSLQPNCAFLLKMQMHLWSGRQSVLNLNSLPLCKLAHTENN